MQLHYKGKYNKNPESLPQREHMPGAVKFREVENSKEMAIVANVIALWIFVLLAVPAIIRCNLFTEAACWQLIIGSLSTLFFLFVHEFLHAICFKEHVYLYTNWSEGMLFVVGPETMSRARYVGMSFLPNIVLGVIPYLVGMIFPQHIVLLTFGVVMTASGAGDYYNIYNAMTQMPKGARTYIHQFNSYWYMP